MLNLVRYPGVYLTAEGVFGNIRRGRLNPTVAGHEDKDWDEVKKTRKYQKLTEWSELQPIPQGSTLCRDAGGMGWGERKFPEISGVGDWEKAGTGCSV